MNYVLYFNTYDNDTYFYNTLEDLLENWDCRTLDEFEKEYDNDDFCILKIDKIILDNKGE